MLFCMRYSLRPKSESRYFSKVSLISVQLGIAFQFDLGVSKASAARCHGEFLLQFFPIVRSLGVETPQGQR